MWILQVNSFSTASFIFLFLKSSAHLFFTLEPVDDEEPRVEFSLEDNVSNGIVELPGVCGLE